MLFYSELMKKIRFQKQKEKVQQFARERIQKLFAEAAEVYKKQPELAHRYVKLAKNLAMKWKTGFPRELKRQYCKHCLHYLVPGWNCRVRITGKTITYFCMDCKHQRRFGY